MRFTPAFAILLSAVAPAAEPSAVENAVTAARLAWDVPGIAVAVVRNGQPPLLIAQGTKRIG